MEGRRQLHVDLRLAALLGIALSLLMGPHAQADEAQKVRPRTTNLQTGAHVKEERNILADRLAGKDAQTSNSDAAKHQGKAKNVTFNAPPVMWETKTRICTGGGLDPMCSATIIDCRDTGGGSPRLIWMRPEGTTEWMGPWQRCTPGYPAAPDTNDPTIPRTPPPPPVPTITQIREAFLELPFAKPTVSTNPGEVDGKTLKDFKTYYAASWPDEGLAPGDVSKPVKLLSWTIEFKIASKDYRYDFGDGHTSGWTSSTGGVYPDGDVTHSYQEVGTKDIKVDARLVGQYRVNGGAWQDLGAVADLQDEPVADIQVVGTRTRLQAY